MLFVFFSYDNRIVRLINPAIQNLKLRILIFLLGWIAICSPAAKCQVIIASDIAGNYGSSWTNGSNQGFGFLPWVLTSHAGTGSAGHFLGNPTDAGISGMSNPSFALFANPGASGAGANADRPFAHPLPVGATLSIDWGVNWDSGIHTGNKGFNIYTGGTGGTQIINVNMGNSAVISINGNTMFSVYGTQRMTLHFTLVSTGSLRVHGTGRNGAEVFDQTFPVAGAPDAIRFYASGMQPGNQRQPYFNNLQIAFLPQSVTLPANITVSGITISPGSTLSLGSHTLTIAANGFFRNDGAFQPQTGSVVFRGQSQVLGSSQSEFTHAVVEGENIRFGTGATGAPISRIASGGVLEIRSGFIGNHAPEFLTNSTLRYFSGSNYNRIVEWNNPWNVHITGNTHVNLNVNAFNNHISMRGNLTIDSGSSLFVDAGPDLWDFSILGDITINGTLTLSSTPGRDLFISGNWNRPTGIFNHNDREVIFNGTSSQQINHHTTFSFLRFNNTGGRVTLNSPVVVTNRMIIESGAFVNLQEHVISGTGTFSLADGGGIGIGHLQGITLSGAVGNIQLSGTRSFAVSGVYHYLGNGNQLSGNGLPTATGPKAIIVELGTNEQEFRLNTTTAVSVGSGGRVEIRRGLLVEAEPAADGRHLDGAGSLIMSGGSYRFERTTTAGGQPFPRLTGPYNITGGTIALNGQTNSANAVQRLRGGETYFHVLISGNSTGGGFKTLSSAITINGDFTITGNNVFEAGNHNLAGPGRLVMTGGLLRLARIGEILPQLSGDYLLSGGTIELYGTNANQSQTLRGGRTYHNLELHAMAPNVWGAEGNINIGSSITVNGSLNVNPYTVFQTAHNFTVSGPGSFNLANGAYLRFGNAAGITPIGIDAGNIRTANRNFSKGAGYVFIGTNDMVAGLGLPDTVAQLVVNKSANPVRLSRSVTVTGGTGSMLQGAFILNNGHLMTETHQLTIASFSPEAIVAGPGNTSFLNSFVVGNLRRHVDISNPNPYSFPVGAIIGSNTLLQHAILEFSDPNALPSGPATRGFLTGTFVAEPSGVFALPHPVPMINGAPVIERLNTGFWSFFSSPSTFPADFRARLTLTSRGHSNGATIPEAHAVLSRADLLSSWQIPRPGQHSGLTQTGSGTNPITAIVSQISSFANFAIARSDNTPLPVELLTFSGWSNSKSVILNWATATETNNDFFTLLRSSDGQNFQEIGRVKGKGFSNRKVQYTFEDFSPINGISYYRLRQTDYDGKWEYIGLVAVRHGIENSFEGISVTGPFYGSGHIWIIVSHEDPDAKIAVSFHDIGGRLLHHYKTLPGVVFLPHHLPKGYVIVRVQCNRWQTAVRIIKPW